MSRFDTERLADVLLKGESQTIEFFASTLPLEIARVLASFANSQGGTLLLGVDELGTPMGLDEGAARDSVDQALATIDPAVDPDIYALTSDERLVLLVTVGPSDRPRFVRGAVWVRVGSGVRPATGQEILAKLSVDTRIAPPSEGNGAEVGLQVGEVLKGENQSYVVEHLLGEGGTAWVYQVRAGDRPLAAKKLHGQRFPLTEPMLARFEREIEIASRIDHPNLVRTMGKIVHGGRPVCLMELMPGDRLKDRVDVDVPSAAVAIRWMRDLAMGLAELHRNNVVHRDISPKNAMFRADGTLALCDFGVSRKLDDATLTHAKDRMGSLIYIAPEQYADAHSATPASDVFALGQVFYFIATGKAPLGNPKSPKDERQDCHLAISDLVQQLRQHQPQKRPVNGESVCRLIEEAEHLVRRDPEDVFSSMVSRAASIDAELPACFHKGFLVHNSRGMGSYVTGYYNAENVLIKASRRIEIMPDIMVADYYFSSSSLFMVRSSLSLRDGAPAVQSVRCYSDGELLSLGRSEGVKTGEHRRDDVEMARVLFARLEESWMGMSEDAEPLPEPLW